MSSEGFLGDLQIAVSLLYRTWWNRALTMALTPFIRDLSWWPNQPHNLNCLKPSSQRQRVRNPQSMLRRLGWSFVLEEKVRRGSGSLGKTDSTRQKQSTVRNRPGCSEGSVLAVRTDELGGGRNTGYKKTWKLQRNLGWILFLHWWPAGPLQVLEQEYTTMYKRKWLLLSL